MFDLSGNDENGNYVERCPIKSLWYWVLVRSIYDAVGIFEYKSRSYATTIKRAKMEAITFFRNTDIEIGSFNWITDILTNGDPAYFRVQILKLVFNETRHQGIVDRVRRKRIPRCKVRKFLGKLPTDEKHN